MTNTVKYTLIGAGAGLVASFIFGWGKIISIGIGGIAGYAVSQGVGNIKIPSASV